MGLLAAAFVAVLVFSGCSETDLSTPDAIAEQLQDDGLGCADLEVRPRGPTLEGREIFICTVLGEQVTIHTVDHDEDWDMPPTDDGPREPVIYQVFEERWLIATESEEAATRVHEVLGGTLRRT